MAVTSFFELALLGRRQDQFVAAEARLDGYGERARSGFRTLAAGGDQLLAADRPLASAASARAISRMTAASKRNRKAQSSSTSIGWRACPAGTSAASIPAGARADRAWECRSPAACAIREWRVARVRDRQRHKWESAKKGAAVSRSGDARRQRAIKIGSIQPAQCGQGRCVSRRERADSARTPGRPVMAEKLSRSSWMPAPAAARLEAARKGRRAGRRSVRRRATRPVSPPAAEFDRSVGAAADDVDAAGRSGRPPRAGAAPPSAGIARGVRQSMASLAVGAQDAEAVEGGCPGW